MNFRDTHLLRIVRQFESQRLPLDVFLSNYFRAHKSLGSHDRKEILPAVYGMIRWKTLLDHLSGSQNDWEQRYACFRSFNPTTSFIPSTIAPHIRVSTPKFLFDHLSSHYGEQKALELCWINNFEAPITVRINPLKTTREAVLQLLQKYTDATPCTVSHLGITCKKRLPFFEMQEFKEGHFEVQDEGSQLVALQVQPHLGAHVLDYCAGSGGKTLGFSHLLQNTGQVYLHDVRPAALKEAKKRILRAGMHNIQFLKPTLKQKMDWVLVDAPCSGTGTLRRNPDLKWKFTPEMLSQLVSKQREIFAQALKFLKPNGKIVYATCSLLREENEEQMQYFLSTHNLRLVNTFVTLPTMGGMDGFFAATFSG